MFDSESTHLTTLDTPDLTVIAVWGEHTRVPLRHTKHGVCDSTIRFLVKSYLSPSPEERDQEPGQ